MAGDNKALLKKLKKQVTVLKRKEKAGRNKLRAALAKLKKSGKGYKRKLEQQAKSASDKTSAAVAGVYAKLASNFRKKGKVKKSSRPKKSAKKSTAPRKRKAKK